MIYFVFVACFIVLNIFSGANITIGSAKMVVIGVLDDNIVVPLLPKGGRHRVVPHPLLVEKGTLVYPTGRGRLCRTHVGDLTPLYFGLLWVLSPF